MPPAISCIFPCRKPRCPISLQRRVTVVYDTYGMIRTDLVKTRINSGTFASAHLLYCCRTEGRRHWDPHMSTIDWNGHVYATLALLPKRIHKIDTDQASLWQQCVTLSGRNTSGPPSRAALW